MTRATHFCPNACRARSVRAQSPKGIEYSQDIQIGPAPSRIEPEAIVKTALNELAQPVFEQEYGKW